MWLLGIWTIALVPYLLGKRLKLFGLHPVFHLIAHYAIYHNLLNMNCLCQ
jgi:hypothetical protein